MSSITENKIYTVKLTEQTLKELNKAIEKAREETKTKNDIDFITVTSSFSKINFIITLGQCESMGYELDRVTPYMKPCILMK